MPRNDTVDVDPPTPTAIGRARELERALRALSRGDGVLITGASGTGKTHLARRVLEQWQHEHADSQVLRVSGADPGDDHALGAHVGDQWPSLVSLEDAHRLDDDAITPLIRACRNRRTALIATAPKPPRNLSPLVHDGVLERVHLTGFDHDEIAALIHSILDGPVSAGVIRFVWHSSSGNPRYAVDLITSAVADGAVARVDRTWVHTGSAPAESGITDLIAADLASLDPEERDLVDIVALGGPMPLATLVETIDAEVLDSTITSGTLTAAVDDATGDTMVSIDNPRFTELVRSLIPPARRRTLFEQVFTADPHPITHPAHLVRVARWALSGAVTLPPTSLLDATRSAATLGLHEHTETLATASLAALPGRAVGRIDALVLRSEARRAMNRIADAAIDVEAAQVALDEIVIPDGEHADRSLQITTLRANLAQFGRGEADLALKLIDAALTRTTGTGDGDRTGPHEVLRARLEADRVMRLAHATRFDEALTAEPSESGRAHLTSSQQIDLDVALTFARAFRGELDRARDDARHLLRRSIALGERAPWGRVQAEVVLFAILMWTGDRDGTDELVAAMAKDPEPSGFVDHVVRQVGWGLVAAARSNYPDASRELEAAVAHFRISDFTGWLPMTLTWLASTYAAAGRTADAAAALAEARSLPLRASAMASFDLWDHWCRISLTLGDPSAAEMARALIATGTEQQLGLVELWGWHTLAMCDPSTSAEVIDPGRIEFLAGTVRGVLPAARVDHLRAIVADDDALVASTFERLGELGYWVPIPRRGDTHLLTTRQLEIAHLAASGLATVDIAERLFISKRTVDAHLTNVYDRLGVRRRSELAVVLSGSTSSSS